MYVANHICCTHKMWTYVFVMMTKRILGNIHFCDIHFKMYVANRICCKCLYNVYLCVKEQTLRMHMGMKSKSRLINCEPMQIFPPRHKTLNAEIHFTSFNCFHCLCNIKYPMVHPVGVACRAQGAAEAEADQETERNWLEGSGDL
jgi:hypothetical protein